MPQQQRQQKQQKICLRETSYQLYDWQWFSHFKIKEFVIVPLKGWKISNIWEPSKFYSGRNQEQIEARECLQSFGAESFVFQLAIQKYKIKIYRTLILSVVLYGCETWLLTLREERRLRVFEIRVLRRIFEPKWDEVTGEWRKLHNEELNDLYSSPNTVQVIKSRRKRLAGNVTRKGERKGVYRVLVGKTEGKRPLGRPRRR